MASISSDRNGNRTIQFIAKDKKRRSIRFGKMSMKDAERVKVRVEALAVAAMTGFPVDAETARWVAERDAAMLDKLAGVGLIQPREPAKQITLGEFLDGYLERRSDVKAGTQTFYGHTKRNLLDVFGADRPLSSITAGDADDFRRHLLKDQEWRDDNGKRHKRRALSAATVARRCSLARTFFRDAVRRKLIESNPFDDVAKKGVKANPERQQFVDHATIAKVIDACPNAEWRLLVTLSRFGGLRIPSEALTLRWSDIDWPADRMTVHSPKTEHHAGKASRVVPIFPELRPYLEDVLELSPDSEFVLPSLQREAAQQGDWRSVNLRTRFEKIIKKAGLTSWPRLWHNLRASRQTELEEHHPSHVVCAWLGNSESVARKHYLQVRESDFQKALQNPVQLAAAPTRTAPHTAPQNTKTLEKPRVLAKKMGDRGFEPLTSTV